MKCKKQISIFRINLFFILFTLFQNSISAQCWVKVSSKGNSTIAIKNNGTLWAWGLNNSGQLGDGTNINRSIPVQIGTSNNWKHISAGYTSCYAIKNDGTLWAWGYNGAGHLGDGTLINRNVPTQIGTSNDWKIVEAGNYSILALKNNGTLWAWGNTLSGPLGNGTLNNSTVPIQIGTNNDWKEIANNDKHRLALKTNGTLWAWGYNQYGELGNGSTSTTFTLSPIQIGSDNTWKEISVGQSHSMGIKNDGTLWGWGFNLDGRIGDGTNINKSIPTQITSENNWLVICAGQSSTYAIKNDSSLWAWGYNQYGDLGDGTNVTKFIPTQTSNSKNWTKVTSYHAINTTKQLFSWGKNDYGQLGIGTISSPNNLHQQTNSTPCSLNNIIANNDNLTAFYGLNTIISTNIISNDLFNGLPASLSNINISVISSTNSGVILDTTTGLVSVNSTVPIGTYTILYQITDNNNLNNISYGFINVNVICNLSPTFDLIVKDSSDDTGIEPNTITPYMWTSDNIWVRNYNDNGLEHQNPDYSATGNANFVRVRVINNSCVTSLGNEQLKLYWAKASTALSYPNPWMGGITYVPTGASMGSPIGTLNIPILQPGEETILTFPWIVPNPNDYGTDGDQWHFCLLARITATNDPMTSTETTDLNANVRNNNNIAWKNVTVVDILPNNTVNPGGIIAVGNPFNHPKTFFLEMEISDLETGKPIYEEAEIGIKMDDVLYNAWVRGGKEAQLLDSTIEEKRKIVTGNKVILDNLSFNANEIGTLRLDFNFLTKELTDKVNYAYHVIQKDSENGKIIGGETFIINKTPRESFEASTNNNLEVDLNQSIIISADDINEPAIYNWYDSEGNLIYQGKDLEIANAVSEKYKLEVISTVDGYKDYVEVEVKIKPSTLETISPNPAQNNVKIGYKLNSNDSAYLMILGYYGSNGTSNNYILNVNSNEIDINVSNYPSGFYTVALVINGNIIDAKTLIKQ